MLGCVPQSLILCLIFAAPNQRYHLSTFTVALLRGVKLVRFGQVAKFFETKEIEQQKHMVLRNRKPSAVMNMRTI